MLTSKPKRLTAITGFFWNPKMLTHQQYESLRSHFVEGLTSSEAISKFNLRTISSMVLTSKTNMGIQASAGSSVDNSCNRIAGQYQ